MADIKISALPTATTPLTGAELVPIVQSGVTKQTTTSDVLAVPVTSLTASSAVATDASKKLVSVANTGTGNNVLATSPTLVTPILGTPQSVTLTNATGLPISTGVSGLGTGVATALAVNVGTAGSPVVNGGALGTPSSGTVTNLTGTASININGTVGATTPAAGTFTSLNTGQLAGLRNKIINGNAQIYQRGNVSVSTVNSIQYGGADRIGLILGATTGSSVLARLAFGVTSSGYGQAATSTTMTGSAALYFATRLEAADVFALNSKTITIKAIVQHDVGSAINVTHEVYGATSLDSGYTIKLSTDNLVSVSSGVPTVVTLTMTLGASAATNGLQITTRLSSGAVTSKNFYIGDLQLEIGSVATPFEQRPYGMELALCQRYLPAFNASGTYGTIANGYNETSTTTRNNYLFIVTPRVAPTGITISAAGDFTISIAGGSWPCTGLSFSDANTQSCLLIATVVSGLTAGQGNNLRQTLSSGQILFTGCEL